MNSNLKKFLILLPLGILGALVVSWAQGLLASGSLRDSMRILSDGFFVAGGLILCAGLLIWTANGGVWDGIAYSFKMAVGRVKREFEENKMSFHEYQKQRAAKASSPVAPVLAGLVLLVIACVFLGIYYGQ